MQTQGRGGWCGFACGPPATAWRQSLKTPAFGTTAALLTKCFLAVDGTPLGGAHAHAPSCSQRIFIRSRSCGDLISCHETLRLLPAACSPRSVVLDESQAPISLRDSYPRHGPRGGRPN